MSALPYFDEIDPEAVDVLLITQYVYCYCCYEDEMIFTPFVVNAIYFCVFIMFFHDYFATLRLCPSTFRLPADTLYCPITWIRCINLFSLCIVKGS